MSAGHEHETLTEALAQVPPCSWHGFGAYPETCWWCNLNRAAPLLARVRAEAARETADRARVVLADYGHLDTCQAELSPGAGYPCNCWRAALRAVLADHNTEEGDQ